MRHAARTTATFLTCGLTLVSVGCNHADKAAGGDAKVEGAKKAPISANAPKTQLVKSPCDWISRADAEKAMGESLTVAPVRARSAENAIPQADGDACLYQLKSTSAFSEGKVALEVTADDPGTIQSGFGSAPMIDSTFKGKESHGDSMVNGRWDYESNLPGGIAMERAGRIVIQVFAFGKSDQGKALANAVIDHIADLPFVNDSADLAVPSEDPDPCSLVTRAEAEAVLGPLMMAPFRSRESSALAYGSGASCTYYTGKHRALVITPTYRGGAARYRMMAGVGNMAGSVLGGAKAPDTLDGPWDQISTSATGVLVLMKGDKNVDIEFQSSNVDYAHAIKVARVAAAKL